MNENKHLNTKSDCIKYFMQLHSDVFDNTLVNEKELFITFAKSMLENLEGAVRGWEYEIDYDGFIIDLFFETFQPIIKPLLVNNRELLNKLDDVLSKNNPKYIVIKDNKINKEPVNKN